MTAHARIFVALEEGIDAAPIQEALPQGTPARIVSLAEAARLPHTVGLVTDLDAHLTERALTSLHAELRRRERILRARGATDLDEHAASGSENTLPRLVVVVDEFATLVEELPDFVRGLVGVAQRGRSLGVHLVLAEQVPLAHREEARGPLQARPVVAERPCCHRVVVERAAEHLAQPVYVRLCRLAHLRHGAERYPCPRCRLAR